MVKHVPSSANNWPLHYWKLPHVECTGQIDLQTRLDTLNFFWPASATKCRLQQLSDRASQSLLSYDSCTTTELHTFSIQRRLITADEFPTTPGFASTRTNLISVLENADDARTFPILDLPPELREEIYAHHILSLLPPAHAPHEALLTKSMTMPPPPLTYTCRLLRTESLPIFYDLHRAKIGILDPYGDIFGDGAYVITEPVNRLIARASDVVIGRYQRLEISGIVSLNGRSSGRCGVWFEVDLSREGVMGKVRRTGMFGANAAMDMFREVVGRMKHRLNGVLGELSQQERGLGREDLEAIRSVFEAAVRG